MKNENDWFTMGKNHLLSEPAKVTNLNKYTFFYAGGAESSLSQVSFDTEDADSAWELWRKFDNLSCLKVRLVTSGEVSIIFKE